MIVRQALAMLAIVALAAPALAAPATPSAPPGTRAITVEDKGDEHGKKNAKGKAKHEDGKKNERSNKGGAARGSERSDQVQGMQDTGKGPPKRQ